MKIKVTKKLGKPINRDMIGLFFEDINYGLDGGLHAEMIENRSFEFVETTGDRDNYKAVYDGLYGWSPYPTEENVSLKIRTDKPLNDVNPHYLEVTAEKKNRGFSNKAYDGVYLKKEIDYSVSFYAKSSKYDGDVEVIVVKDGRILAKASVEYISRKWTLYRAKLRSSEDVAGGTFVIRLKKKGTVSFDFISMIPEDAVMGLFRRDLTELLKDMKPGFLRFPGGCVVEGNTIENRYRWKKSIGAPEERKANWNRWAVQCNSEDNGFRSRYSHYNQTLGIGFYEYFLLCEYLGAKPLPVMNVGLACQFMSEEMVSADDPKFKEYVDDILDLIEFANGSEDSEWGAVRTKMGHREPFELELIGVGNEQWETERADFFKRYDIIEKAVHEKWPDIKLIGSAGPDVSSGRYTAAWNFYKERSKKNSSHVYAVDEHYYVKPEWMLNNTGFYDNYPRDIKVFAGEYAAHHAYGMNRPELNDWNAALAEAAFMTGLERNGDVVAFASYAPLFARLGYAQWSPNMIWFNSEGAYGTPSYYVQKLYSTEMGTNISETECEGNEIPYSVTYDKNENTLIIKLVNPIDKSVTVNIETCGKVKNEVEVLIMQGQDFDINTIDARQLIAPVKNAIESDKLLSYEVGSKSFHVIKAKCI